MITRWVSWGVATVLAVILLMTPRLALAQGIAATDNGESQGMKFVAGGIGSNANYLGSAAAGGGVGNPLGFDSPPSSNLSLKDSTKMGMAAAPELIKAAQLSCTLSEARFMFSAVGADKGKAKVYEVACQEGLGYVIAAPAKAGAVPVIFDCMAMAQPVRGKPNPMACKLAGNADPAKGLSSIVVRSGRACAVEKGRYLGSTEDLNVYEVACHDGGGYILEAAKAPGGATTATACSAYGAASNLKCILSAPDQQLAVAGPADTPQTQTAPDGPYSDLAKGTYSDLAKTAGFDCAVSKYADFPPKPNGAEVVELACSNRPDGGVGVFPATGRPVVWDCLRSQAEGYRCSFSSQSDVYGQLTNRLKAKGTSCVVNGARLYGRTSEGADLIEISCADGGPGWVLEYPARAAEPSGALRNCTQASAASGGGGCRLAANKAHG